MQFLLQNKQLSKYIDWALYLIPPILGNTLTTFVTLVQ